MQRFYILAWAAILILGCSLTNGATIGAATLATPSPTPAAARIYAIPSPSPTPELCIVSAYHLNLRDCAGTGCEVIGTLDQGDRLTVTERGPWLSVETKAGAAGFVNSNYCQIGE